MIRFSHPRRPATGGSGVCIARFITSTRSVYLAVLRRARCKNRRKRVRAARHREASYGGS